MVGPERRARGAARGRTPDGTPAAGAANCAVGRARHGQGEMSDMGLRVHAVCERCVSI